MIDDKSGKTLAFSSTLESTFNKNLLNSATSEGAKWVGENLAEKALPKNISIVVFDRGNRPYHGRIQKVAEGAREKGLIF